MGNAIYAAAEPSRLEWNKSQEEAKPTDDCGRWRTTAEVDSKELGWTVIDICERSPAVFKTVCGALLRRPGRVRFPSIPATPDQGQMVDWRIRWPQIGRR